MDSERPKKVPRLRLSHFAQQLAENLKEQRAHARESGSFAGVPADGRVACLVSLPSGKPVFKADLPPSTTVGEVLQKLKPQAGPGVLVLANGQHPARGTVLRDIANKDAPLVFTFVRQECVPLLCYTAGCVAPDDPHARLEDFETGEEAACTHKEGPQETGALVRQLCLLLKGIAMKPETWEALRKRWKQSERFSGTPETLRVSFYFETPLGDHWTIERDPWEAGKVIISGGQYSEGEVLADGAVDDLAQEFCRSVWEQGQPISGLLTFWDKEWLGGAMNLPAQLYFGFRAPRTERVRFPPPSVR